MNAVEAAVAVAREHGVRVDDPRVLKDAHNLVLHLAPAPVVARVGQLMSELRPGIRERELALTLWLEGRGLPVLGPSSALPERMHERGGYSMTFWPYVSDQQPRDGVAAARALREIQEALPDYRGDVLAFWPVYETRELLATRVALPAEVGESLERVASALSYDGVLVHGDAQFNNCFFTAAGPLWADLEDACLAPPEWDAACLAAAFRFIDDDPEYETALAELLPIENATRLELLVALRVIVFIVWTAMRYGRHERVDMWIEWLRRNVS